MGGSGELEKGTGASPTFVGHGGEGERVERFSGPWAVQGSLGRVWSGGEVDSLLTQQD